MTDPPTPSTTGGPRTREGDDPAKREGLVIANRAVERIARLAAGEVEAWPGQGRQGGRRERQGRLQELTATSADQPQPDTKDSSMISTIISAIVVGAISGRSPR